jgi:hypothetical protein
MIWAVRQFITHQTLQMGFERLKFPIRVEFEFQKEGTRVFPESIRKKVLYNKTFLLKRYPDLKERDLDLRVEERVREAIQNHLTILDETG